MEKIRESHAGGISIIAFVIVVFVSLFYYQFIYVPEANRKPILAEEVLNPPESIKVSIVEGSALPSQTRNFEPKDVRGIIGVSNKIVWTNEDSVPHTVTSDDGYTDIINGKFDSLARDEVGFLDQGETFEFTFTNAGEYPYHCEPHPWMKGKITIVENFS